MSEQSTTTRPVFEALIRHAEGATEAQCYAALRHFLSGDLAAPADKSAKAKSGNGSSINRDNVIAQNIAAFRAINKHLEAIGGRARLGDLWKEGDRRSLSPFKSIGEPASCLLLARYFSRNRLRLEPGGSPGDATPDVVVWTKQAYAEHTK